MWDSKKWVWRLALISTLSMVFLFLLFTLLAKGLERIDLDTDPGDLEMGATRAFGEQVGVGDGWGPAVNPSVPLFFFAAPAFMILLVLGVIWMARPA